MKNRRRFLSFAVLVSFSGCQSGASTPTSTPVRQATVASEEPAASLSTEATPESPAVEVFEAGEQLLEEAGFPEGTIVIRRSDGTMLVTNPSLSTERYWPCSTFKIPNSLIGLESGVIPDADFTLTWDGTSRHYDSWNRDHDLASALEHSVVWFYQELARRVGDEEMRRWIERLDYGNEEVGESVDTFWLEGPLAISAVEQVEFVEGLTAGRHPFSDRTVETIRRIMPRREHEGSTIVGKTGTCIRGESCHAWLVGWVEREGAVVGHFALLVVEVPEGPQRSWRLRWELVIEALERAGMVGGASEPVT